MNALTGWMRSACWEPRQVNEDKPAPSLLVTGFEPFGGSTLNPSQVIVQAIQAGGITLGKAVLHAALLPVDTQRIAGEINALWQRIDPDVVIHVGESARADRLTLERVALNLLDFETPDNAGELRVDQPIDPSGPPARFSTLPMRVLRDRLKREAVDSALSLSAGAYLCNQALYLSLAHAERRVGRQVGFVHVPSLPDQVQAGERPGPAMPRESLIEQFQKLMSHAIDLHRVDV